MPTPDAIETDMNTLAAAARALNTDGDTGGVVTATDLRKFIIRTYSGERAHFQIADDLKRGTPPVFAVTGGTVYADGVILVCDTTTETVCVMRVRK